MPRKGKGLTFHGSYTLKRNARRKEAAGVGRFILVRTLRGRRRYLVVSRKER